MDKEKLEHIIHRHLSKLNYHGSFLEYQLVSEDKTLFWTFPEKGHTTFLFRPQFQFKILIVIYVNDEPKNVESNASFMKNLARAVTDLENELNNRKPDYLYYELINQPIKLDPSLDQKQSSFWEKMFILKEKENALLREQLKKEQ